MNATDFRPISCCTVIYKSVSKIMCNRLKKVLPYIISPSQGAFVQGRELLCNVLLSQELARGYNRQHISPTCLMKIDLRKAYDSVQWDFIEEMMEHMRFPKIFIKWVMACVKPHSLPSFLMGGQQCISKGEGG